MNSEAPTPHPPFARFFALPQKMTDQVRGLVDGALDKVFDEPFDIRSANDFERVLLEPSNVGRSGAAASALAGFVAMATPFAERTLRLVRVGGKAPLPAARAAKYAAVAVPIGMQLSTTVRRGVREIQALASYLIHKLRDAGLEPERGLVRALTVSLYLDPDRRPNLQLTAGKAATSLSRVWIFRAIGTDSENHVRKRGQAWILAIERLDLATLARDPTLARDQGARPDGNELTS